MKSYRFLLPVCALALSGCAHYADPFTGPTAKLRVVSLPGSATEVRELDDPRCVGRPGVLVAQLGISVKNGANQGRSLHMPLQESVPQAAASEINVRAGQPFAAQFKLSASPGPRGLGWSYPACVKSFVLTPKEGEQYEAQVEQLHGACHLNVFRLSRERDGSHVRRVAENGRELKARCAE